MGCLRSAAIAFALMMAVYMSDNADAAELKVLSSGALKLALVQLVPEFQKSSSNAVTIEYDHRARLRPLLVHLEGVMFSDRYPGDGKVMFRHSCSM